MRAMMAIRYAWAVALASVIGVGFPFGAAPDLAAPSAAPAVARSIVVGLSPTAVAIDGQTARAFVTNWGLPPAPGSVSVLDTRSGALVRTVSVGVAPRTVVVAARAGRAFVLNRGGSGAQAAGSVTMLDAASGRALRTIVLGRGVVPAAAAVDATTGYLLIATTTAQGAIVDVLDARRGSIKRKIPVGTAGPIALAAAAGRVLLITADDRVTVLATGSGRVLHRVRMGRGAAALAVDAALGRAVVVNQTSDTVSLLDVARGVVLRTVPVGRVPMAVAVDVRAGRAVVTNAEDGTASLLALSSGAVARTATVGQTPQAVAIDGQGHAIIATTDGVSVLDVASGRAVGFAALSSGVTTVAIDTRTEHVFAVNPYADTVSLLAVSAVRAPIPVAPPMPPPPTSGTGAARARALVQAFVRAYNARDIGGVLAPLAADVAYGDCDERNRVFHILRGRAAVRAWVRAQFATRMRFIATGLSTGSTTAGPRMAVAVFGLRTSDALRAQGRIAPLNWKFILARPDGPITTANLSSAERCAAAG